jgi:pyruvate kinase
MSFVRSAADIIVLQDKIKLYLAEGRKVPRTMAKIEMPDALVNFDGILAEVDSIMVARGDLGLESPIFEVPVQQKRMIKKCLVAKKFVITATEMLGSMQYNPRPTRAEVSDVANAVLDHTDAIMLSGETAMGKYPVRAIQMMTDIITVTEASEFYSV